MFAKHRVLCAGVICLSGALAAHAQDKGGVKVEVPKEGGVRVQVQRRDAAHLDHTDHQIAQMLIHGDEAEVAISQAAAAKVQDPEVKKFADKMIEAHSAAIKSLPAQPAAATSQLQQRPAPADRNGLDLATLSAEMRDECIRSAKAELEKKEGRELEACYVGMQIAAHQGALSKINVLKRHASPALQEQLSARAKTTAEHLQHAIDLMKRIDAKSPKTAQK